MTIKCILGFKFQDVPVHNPAFTQVHYYLGAAEDTEDKALRLSVADLFNAYLNICGNNVRGQAVRLSLVGKTHESDTIYADPVEAHGSPLQITPSTDWGTCEPPNSSLKITIKSQTNRSRNMYCAGLPDAFIVTGPKGGPRFDAPGLGGGFERAWNLWTAEMLNGFWGFPCLNSLPPGQPQKISFFVQVPAPALNIAFVLPNTAAYKPAVGEIVHVRGTLMGVSGLERPIGRWKVKDTQAFDDLNTQYELDQSSAFSSAMIREGGTVESTTRGYQLYNSMGNFLEGSRRRGIGSFRPRGRSRRPRRLQPGLTPAV